MYSCKINNNRKKAFTLIELLIVIAIIGLLSTLAVAALGPARSKARDAKRRGDLVAIQKAMEMYKDSNSTQSATTSAAALGAFIQGGFPKPTDNNHPYYLCKHSTNVGRYLIATRLENLPENPTFTAPTLLSCIQINQDLSVGGAITYANDINCGDDITKSYCIYFQN